MAKLSNFEKGWECRFPKKLTAGGLADHIESYIRKRTKKSKPTRVDDSIAHELNRVLTYIQEIVADEVEGK